MSGSERRGAGAAQRGGTGRGSVRSGSGGSSAQEQAAIFGGIAGAIFGGISAVASQSSEQRRQRQQGHGGRSASSTLSSLIGGAVSGAAQGAAIGALVGAAVSGQPVEEAHGTADRTAESWRQAGRRQHQSAIRTLDELFGLFQRRRRGPVNDGPTIEEITPGGALAEAGNSASAGACADGGGAGSTTASGTPPSSQRTGSTQTLDEILQLLSRLRSVVSGVPAAASAASIANLPVVEHVPTAGAGSGEDEEDVCCICLDALVAGDKTKKLPCSHSGFHAACIDEWLGRGAGLCPICRHEVA
jgi:hypothetical protein